MSAISRKTYDTDVLTMRRIFANDPDTNNFISAGLVLITGEYGSASFGDILTISSLSQLSTIASVGVLPGICSLSTVVSYGLSSLSTLFGSNGTFFYSTTNYFYETVSTVYADGTNIFYDAQNVFLNLPYLSSYSLSTGNVSLSSLTFKDTATNANQTLVVDNGTLLLNGAAISGDVNKSNLVSTVVGLGTAGYISSSQLTSTTSGIYNFVSSFIDITELTSTIVGLGTAGFVSTIGLESNLASTVTGLGTAGYISSSQLTSTTSGIYNFVSSFIDVTELTSTIVGLGTAGFVSTIGLESNLASTVTGLGTAGYISSSQLTSTTTGIYNFVSSFIDVTELTSTIIGLGTAGFVSTIGLESNLVSTVAGLGTAGYASTSFVTSEISSFSTALGSVGSGNLTTANLVSTVVGLGTTGYASTSFVTSEISSFSTALGSVGSGNLTTANLVSTVMGLGTAGYASTSFVTSQISSFSTALGSVGSGNLTTANLVSTVVGLGTAGYISSSQLTSTTTGIYNFVSSFIDPTELTSTIIGLGTAGFVSTIGLESNLASTVTGLGTAGYISSSQLTSTTTGLYNFVSSFIDAAELTSSIIGLGTAGYASTTFVTSQISSFSSALGSIGSGNLNTSNLVSTVIGLGTAGYISSSQLTSTTTGLYNFVSSFIDPTELTSTIIGLGTAGFVSSIGLQSNLASTVIGLGTAGYISSSQLTSTTAGLYNFVGTVIDATELTSSIIGLGTAGYASTSFVTSEISSFSSAIGSIGTGNLVTDNLVSTVAGLGISGYLSSSQLTSTVAGLGTAGYISSSTLVSSLSNWSIYPAISTVVLNSNDSRIVGITATSIFETQILRIQDYTNATGVVEADSLKFVKNLNNIYYQLGKDSFITGSIDALALRYGDGTPGGNQTGSLYISSLYLGNLGGTIYGELTTNDTASDVFWNGSSLTEGIKTADLVSTFVGIEKGLATEQVSTGFVQLSTLNMKDPYTNAVNFLTVSSGTLLLNGGFITGSGGSAVSQIIAGTNISISPGGGTGIVTINNAINPSGLVSTPNLSSLVSTSFLDTTLVSTVEGLGAAGYISTSFLDGAFVSTVEGLGTAGYVSTSFLDTTLVSTLEGLGTAGYVSTLNGGMFTLTPTTPANILLSPPTNTFKKIANGGSDDFLGTQEKYPFVAVSFQTNFSVLDFQTVNLDRGGVNQYYGLLFHQNSFVYVQINGGASASLGTYDSNATYSIQLVPDNVNYYINNNLVYSTGSAPVSGSYNVIFNLRIVNDTILNLAYAGTPSPTQAAGSALYFNTPLPLGMNSIFASTIEGLGSFGYVSTSFLDATLVSTVEGLGSFGYLSTSFLDATLVSTVEGLGTAGYVSSSFLDGTLVSTVEGLGTAGYVSTSFLDASLVSTIEGLGSFGYISTSFLDGTLVSTVEGLGTAGYVSTSFLDATLVSTVEGLGNYYLSSLPPYISSFTVSTGSINVSSLVFLDILDASIQGSIRNTGGGLQYRAPGNHTFLNATGTQTAELLALKLTLTDGFSVDYNYEFAAGSVYTGTVSAPTLYNGSAGILAPMYLSSLFLGDFKGITYGQLTTDGTATNIYWNGSTLINSYSLVSTTAGLETSFIGQQMRVSSLYVNLDPNDAPAWNSNTPAAGFDPEPNPLAVDVFGSVRFLKNVYIGSTTTKIGTGGIETALLYVSTITALSLVSTVNLVTSTVTFMDINTAQEQVLAVSSGVLTLNGQGIGGGGGGDVTSADLISTFAGIQKSLATEQISTGFVQLSTLNMIDGFTNDVNFLTVSSGTLLLNGSFITGSGGTAVSQILAGSNIIVSPASGTGIVTINNTINPTNLVSTANLSNLGTLGYVSTSQLVSTVVGLGTAGYISSSQLTSTTAGILSALPIGSNLASTVTGLGTAGYISSSQLTSTTTGLYNYISSFIDSTELTSSIIGLGSAGYISSTQLTSTTIGTFDYISSFFSTYIRSIAYFYAGEIVYLNYSIPGTVSPYKQLGTNNIIGPSFSDVFAVPSNSSNNFVVGFQSDFTLPSFIATGLWVVSLFCQAADSTVEVYASLFLRNGAGTETLITSSSNSPFIVPQTKVKLDLIFDVPYTDIPSDNTIVIKIFTNNTKNQVVNFTSFYENGNYSYVRTTFGVIIAQTIICSTIEGLGTYGYVSTSQLVSTVVGLGSAGYISSTQLTSTTTGLYNFMSSFIDSSELTSSIIGLGSAGYVSTSFLDSSLVSTVEGLGAAGYISTSFLDSSLVSTVEGLGAAGYVSTSFLDSSLISTVEGLGAAGYVSTSFLDSSLVSTVEGLGAAGYVSSSFLDSSLVSTVEGLGVAGYISSSFLDSSLVSTVEGLGVAGYISTSFLDSSLVSTVEGLGVAGYISSSFLDSSLVSTVQGLNYVAVTEIIAGTNISISPTPGIGIVTVNATGVGVIDTEIASTLQKSAVFSNVAIGYNAGITTQGAAAIAIGCNAGNFTQGINSIAIGQEAGYSNQGDSAIGIGLGAGYDGQSNHGIAIGYYAGYGLQQDNSIAIGYLAGSNSQKLDSIAIGTSAGEQQQSNFAIALGYAAGSNLQGEYTVAIGYQAGLTSQQNNSIAIGQNAGNTNQGDYSIAIGNNAGTTNQFTSSIIINATGAPLESSNIGLFVSPLRYIQGQQTNALGFISSTSEIGYVDPTESLSNWSFYPALTDVVLYSNAPTIANTNEITPILLRTPGVDVLDANSGPGYIQVSKVTVLNSTTFEEYTLSNSPTVTGAIQALGLHYFDKVVTQTGSLYVSSLYLGNLGGTVAGQLTTDDTAGDVYWNGVSLTSGGGGITAANLISTVEGLGEAGYISSSQFQSTSADLYSSIRNWAIYPAVSSIVFNTGIDQNQIIAPGGGSMIEFITGKGLYSLSESLDTQQVLAGGFVIRDRYDAADTSAYNYQYAITATEGKTGTVSSVVVLDYVFDVAPLYLSSLYFGNTGGSLVGELTTDPTFTNLYWNGVQLNGAGGVTSNDLVSTTSGLQTKFIGQEAQLSTLYMNMDPNTAPFWDSNVPIVGPDPEPNPLALDVFGSVRILKNLYIGSTTTKLTTLGVFAPIVSTQASYFSSVMIEGNNIFDLFPFAGTLQDQFTSTVAGLGEAGYISTSQLVSTTFGLTNSISTIVSTLVKSFTANYGGEVLYMNYSVNVDSYKELSPVPTSNTVQTVPITVNQTSTSNMVGFQSDFSLPPFIPAGLWDMNLYVNSSSATGTFVYFDLYTINGVTETLIVSGSNSLVPINTTQQEVTISVFVPTTNFVSGDAILVKVVGSNSRNQNETITTYYEDGKYSHIHTTFGTIIPAAVLASTVGGLGAAGYISSSQLTSTTAGLVLPGNLASTVIGLGTAGYISSTQLTSTTAGLVLPGNLASTVIGLGTAGYISSTQLTSTTAGLVLPGNLTSTVIGLGTAGYISSVTLISSIQTGLVSTVRGLGTAGYISSATLISSVQIGLVSTVRGLGTAGYVSTANILNFVSTVNLIGGIAFNNLSTNFISAATISANVIYASTVSLRQQFFTDLTTAAVGSPIFQSSTYLYFGENIVAPARVAPIQTITF